MSDAGSGGELDLPTAPSPSVAPSEKAPSVVAGRTRHASQRRGPLVIEKSAKKQKTSHQAQLAFTPTTSNDAAALLTIPKPSASQSQENPSPWQEEINEFDGDVFDDTRAQETEADKTGDALIGRIIHKTRPAQQKSAIRQKADEVYHKGIKSWKCKDCGKIYTQNGGTGAVFKHQKQVHHWDPDSDRVADIRHAQAADIASALARQGHQADEQFHEKRRQHMANTIDKKTLEFLYLKWITNGNIPFDEVEDKDFRAFLQYCNPVAEERLPRAHSTIKNRLIELFEQGRNNVKTYLRAAISEVHITCDLWTSPNHLPILGINAHFTSESKKLEAITLGIKELHGEHTGENIADVIYNVGSDFDILNKLGYFVMDNASNNDTLTEHLGYKLREANVLFDPIRRRLRCLGHVINLVVQDFLFGKSSNDVSYINTEPDLPDVVIPSDDDLDIWRKAGPMGKLHNIVVYVCRSDQRRQYFKKLSNGLSLRRDQATRWHSWYDMLYWVIHRVKPAIIQFTLEDKNLQTDMLRGEEWKTLEIICEFLGVFQEVCKEAEGNNATIEAVLPSMECLMDHFKEACQEHSQEEVILGQLDAGYTKLKKYFNLQDRAPVYVAGVVLNPKYKWELFDWPQKDLDNARDQLQKMWRQDYQGPTGLSERTNETPEPSKPLPKHKAWIESRKKAKADSGADELERYLNEPVLDSIGELTAREWWCHEDQRRRYPLLSRMAIDILSIPAMSTEAERLFSRAKRQIGPARHSLHASTIEASECFRSWLKAGYYKVDELAAEVEVARLAAEEQNS